MIVLSKQLKAALFISIIVLLTGCKSVVDLHTNLSESDANEVVAALVSKGIGAKKISLKDGFSVQIDEADMARATLSGQRLDTAQPGTGLGLAIANDLTYVYGGRLKLERSEKYGGLCAIITLDAARTKSHL